MRLLLVLLAACGHVNELADAPEEMIDAATPMPDAPSNTPMVASVSAPTTGVDAEGGRATVVVMVHGQPAESLMVALSSTLGTYAPASTTVTTDGAGNAMATSVFTAGMTGGTEMSSVVTHNQQGIGAPPKDFTF